MRIEENSSYNHVAITKSCFGSNLRPSPPSQFISKWLSLSHLGLHIHPPETQLTSSKDIHLVLNQVYGVISQWVRNGKLYFQLQRERGIEERRDEDGIEEKFKLNVIKSLREQQHVFPPLLPSLQRFLLSPNVLLSKFYPDFWSVFRDQMARMDHFTPPLLPFRFV